MKRNLTFEVVYPHAPERVWHALTDPRALAEWLMPNDFKPYVGHHFEFHTAPAPGFDGVVRCEVIEADPPRRLAYTWQGGPQSKPTIVTWTLEPVGTTTRVRLEHTGFEGLGGLAVSFLLGRGWRSKVLRQLATLLDRIEWSAET
ncbi:MAG: SRPBCC domain-containing protein [Roseiflexaceae bacterium]